MPSSLPSAAHTKPISASAPVLLILSGLLMLLVAMLLGSLPFQYVSEYFHAHSFALSSVIPVLMTVCVLAFLSYGMLLHHATAPQIRVDFIAMSRILGMAFSSGVKSDARSDMMSLV